MTAADAASSTTKRKGWVDRNDTSDETQDAAEVAAERTRKSVQGERGPSENAMGRKVGTTSTVLQAIGTAPLIAGHVVKETAKKLYDRVYDKRKKSDDEED